MPNLARKDRRPCISISAPRLLRPPQRRKVTLLLGSARALARPVRRLAERIERRETRSVVVISAHVNSDLRRGRRKQHARRVRSPNIFATLLLAAIVACFSAVASHAG